VKIYSFRLKENAGIPYTPLRAEDAEEALESLGEK
jgi:hypothetical protein